MINYNRIYIFAREVEAYAKIVAECAELAKAEKDDLYKAQCNESINNMLEVMCSNTVLSQLEMRKDETNDN